MKCPKCYQEIGNSKVCPYCGQNISAYYRGATTVVPQRNGTRVTNDLLRDIKLLLLIIAVIQGGLFLFRMIEVAAQVF